MDFETNNYDQTPKPFDINVEKIIEAAKEIGRKIPFRKMQDFTVADYTEIYDDDTVDKLAGIIYESVFKNEKKEYFYLECIDRKDNRDKKMYMYLEDYLASYNTFNPSRVLSKTSEAVSKTVSKPFEGFTNTSNLDNAR